MATSGRDQAMMEASLSGVREKKVVIVVVVVVVVLASSMLMRRGHVCGRGRGSGQHNGRYEMGM